MVCYDTTLVSKLFLSPYVIWNKEVDGIVFSQELFGTMMKIFGDVNSIESLAHSLEKGMLRHELVAAVKTACGMDSSATEHTVKEAIAKGVIE